MVTKVLTLTLCRCVNVLGVCVLRDFWPIPNPCSSIHLVCTLFIQRFGRMPLLLFFPFSLSIHSFIPLSLRTRSSLFFFFPFLSLYHATIIVSQTCTKSIRIINQHTRHCKQHLEWGKRISVTNIIHPCRADGALLLAEL